MLEEVKLIWVWGVLQWVHEVSIYVFWECDKLVRFLRVVEWCINYVMNCSVKYSPENRLMR